MLRPDGERRRRPRRIASPAGVAAALVFALTLGACGAGIAADGSAAQRAGGGTQTGAATGRAPRPIATRAAAPAGSCAATVVRTLGSVALNVYQQAVNGRNVGTAARRLGRSSALAAAVAAGNPAATRTALAPLLKHQIKRIVISHHGRVLMSVGARKVFAPVRGTLRDGRGAVVGSYVMSVMSPASFAGITAGLSGGQVLVDAGTRRIASTIAPAPAPGATGITTGATSYRGVRYATYGFRGDAFPKGRLSVTLLLPPAALTTCGTSAAATRSATLGAVAQRLYRAEAGGTKVKLALRYVTRDRAYMTALAAHDRAGIERAVRNGFFHVRQFHMVRVRASSGAFSADVGGPFVIAPASRTVRLKAGASATITLAIQDDTGYIKLLHRFTGGAVILHEGSTLVPGSNISPGPASLPDDGFVRYHGRRYSVHSFNGVAFPSGPLRISLLLHA